MKDAELRELLDLIMCCDPWPVCGSETNELVIKGMANDESRRRGFDGWVDAYHRLTTK